MNPNNELQEQFSEEINADDSSSIDDFLKELEAKEKDLNISEEMVFEIEETEVSENNIPEFLKAELTGTDQSVKKDSRLPAFAQKSPAGNDAEMSQIKERSAKLEAQAVELKTALKKRQAEFENYRNRTERERNETYQGQIGSLASQLLPVLDNLNRALDIASDFKEERHKDFQNFFNGIVLVNQQLNEVLAEMGVQPVPSVGEPFDPYFHDAVATEETAEFPSNTIIEQLLRGYRLGDRLIRPAMVKVAIPKNQPPEDASPEAE